MPTDIGLDENLDLNINDRNDADLVDGTEQVEQSIRIYLADYYEDNIGSLEADNIVQQLELATRRAFNENDQVDSFGGILVEPTEEFGTYQVEAYYDGNQFTEELP